MFLEKTAAKDHAILDTLGDLMRSFVLERLPPKSAIAGALSLQEAGPELASLFLRFRGPDPLAKTTRADTDGEAFAPPPPCRHLGAPAPLHHTMDRNMFEHDGRTDLESYAIICARSYGVRMHQNANKGHDDRF